MADYGLRHGDLPLGGMALLAQPGWAPAIVCFGLLLLFPDGGCPRARWRWLVGVYVTVAVVWITGAIVITASVLASHHARVDSSGNLLQLTEDPRYGWWNLVQSLFFPLLFACWLGSSPPGAQLPAFVGDTPSAAEVAAGRVGRRRGLDRARDPLRGLPWLSWARSARSVSSRSR